MNEEKYCSKCEKNLTLDNFYKVGNKILSYCKTCRKSDIKTKRTLEYDEDGYPYFCEPFQYYNEQQKQDVEEFLQNIGWIWNDEKQLWFKPGIKDENGKWCYEK
jgi:hypothetical protein